MSRFLLELCGGRVVMLQMKVKLHFSDNLLLMLRKASPSAVLPKMGGILYSVGESLDTSCTRKAVGSCHTEGPFLVFTGSEVV